MLGVEEDDFLIIKKILLLHDPDGRHIDSHTLLRMMENVMCYATTTSSVSQTLAETLLCSNNVVGSHEELWKTIQKVSCEIVCKCCGDEDRHTRTMTLFDLLGNYTWDAKVVMALAAFATSYGEICLLIQLYPINSLAVSITMLKQLPYKYLDILKPRFKALSLLVKSMVDVTKCVIEFEGMLLLKDIRLDGKEISSTKSQIYVAAYWVLRSTLTCSSIFADLIAMNHHDQQVNSTTMATLELSSLVYKMSGIYRKLRRQVDKCHLQIEDKLQRKLLDLFRKETDTDNQEVLSTLFSLKDDMPFKDCSSQAKLGVSELVNKVVVLLVSKPEILPVEELFFLVQQTCRSCTDHEELEVKYEFIWVPISSSTKWTDEEEKVFDQLSSTLPWYSVRQPWLLNLAVINYLKQVSGFVDEPVMVVLDKNGMLTSSNAIDMVYIWGMDAYPFSVSREEQLWKEVNGSMQIIVGKVDTLLSKQVEDGRNICLYGSTSLEWIRELTRMGEELENAGVGVNFIYVGTRRPSDQAHVNNIISTIVRERQTGYLSYPKTQFFWLHLESIRRSKLKRIEKKAGADFDDHLLQTVVSVMTSDENLKSWALFGSLTDILQLQGRKVTEVLKLFQVWGENIDKVGFVGAIRGALEPPTVFTDPCYSCNALWFVEDVTDEATIVCEECKCPMEMVVGYRHRVVDLPNL